MKKLRQTLGRQFMIGLTALSLVPIASPLGRTPGPDPKMDAARQIERRTAATPIIRYTAHSRGNLRLALANNGTFGTEGQTRPDPFTGEPIPSLEYPRGSNIVLLWVGAFWIGAVVDGDTLVSCGTEDFYQTNELWPDPPELGGDFTYGSIDRNSKFYDEDVTAYSEEDIIINYYDTITNSGLSGYDEIDGRGHRPLGVKVTQRSMAWSYDYTDDFILFDYKVENIGRDRLRDVYMGIWVDGDAFHISRNNPVGWTDDIVGFYRFHPAPEGCGFIDTVSIAYHGDNDGDPIPEDSPNEWDYRSARGVVGTRVVRTPAEELDLSFNWWIINYGDASRDFGPRRQGTAEDPFFEFEDGRLGTPSGDLAKYYVLSHREFDYDLIETAVDKTLEGWRPPPENAEEIAYGYDMRYLLSFGPFDIEPGQVLPVTFALVGGENVHVYPTDFARLFKPDDPGPYYNSLDFDGLATNARWASWVYDNPGVDTDGDGYRGEFRICGEGTGDGKADSVTVDTNWHKGDGVPDFRGAGPPQAPTVRIVPSTGKLTIRWNGFYTENDKDIFTNRKDFEGYRVYAGLDERASSFTMLSSFDIENFKRFTYSQSGENGIWIQDEIPLTIAQLREYYGDPDFDPLLYNRANPLRWEGTYSYFETQDFNQSSLTRADGIRKVYPEATNPGTDTSLWTESDVLYDHGEPLPRFYEYEYVYDNVLPTVPYYVSVTAFDHGSPRSGLTALETKPESNYIRELPQIPSDTVEARNLDVFVYPNPYRTDAGYAERGFENRDGSQAPDRARLIHFSNLPRVCTIHIYSIDGDLIRTIPHDYPEGGPGSMHDTWDLITRNTQAVVTGMYYWVVESERRVQTGKLVILK
ncbi:MAG: hypothetical protein KKA42_04280 [candidate division Zixibacteria bacterium]|nr:hypothetical protein [candidate division Zixibacteria bacterium]